MCRPVSGLYALLFINRLLFVLLTLVQWWKTIWYIYSSTVLKYNYKLLLLMSKCFSQHSSGLFELCVLLLILLNNILKAGDLFIVWLGHLIIMYFLFGAFWIYIYLKKGQMTLLVRCRKNSVNVFGAR